MSGHSYEVLYLDDQPQLCKYANLYPYLEQSSTSSSFEGGRYPYSTVSLGQEGACLAVLTTCSNQCTVLDARTGERLFEISLSENDLHLLLKDSYTCTESGIICCVLLSVVEEYLPTRYLLDLWLVYSNGVEFSVVFLFQFCVKVGLCCDELCSHFCLGRIELLTLPANMYPFQLVKGSSPYYFSLAELHVSLCILGMDIGGPLALFKPWKELSTFPNSSAILVCNYSILLMKVGDNSNGAGLLFEYFMGIEQWPCITSVMLLPFHIWSKEDCTEVHRPCLIIGTIQGNIEWICIDDMKPKRIYQMKTAVKNVVISRQFLVVCDELGDGIIIPSSSLYLCLLLDKPVDERFVIPFSMGCVVQLLEKMNEDTFLLLSNSRGYQYLMIQKEQETAQHHGESISSRFHCNWITLIATHIAYIGWTLSAEFQNQKEDMVYIAIDGSFLVLSSTAISNCIVQDGNSSPPPPPPPPPPAALSCQDSNGGYHEMNCSTSHLFQQMDNLSGMQQRYKDILRELQLEMSRFNSLLHWYDKMRKETQENGFQVAIQQVRRIQRDHSAICHYTDDREESSAINPPYHVVIEWTYQGTELSIPFSMLVQWKNICHSDGHRSDGLVSQHMFHYDQLTSAACERMEIPLYKTNGLSIHFRIFWILHFDRLGPVLSSMSHRYPVWLELPCERNVLDVLDFCEPIKVVSGSDNPTRQLGSRATTTTCRLSNPYRKSFHSSLLPVEWNLSESDWFVPMKTPWNECIVLIQREETIVLQCPSHSSLALFHSCLWKRLNLTSKLPTTARLEERWRDSNKVVLHSLQQAQNELQQAERVLEKMRKSNDFEESIQSVLFSILEAYRLWRGCCFVITSHTN
ncbi:hypothetical protein GpartN1_g7651.t1 [Galdieria partita]|uniref:Uncharacterized protein n=1 Tax=Galdieria partita TaxID=83374 RepID=A0A9C7Q4L9_9RHOD|nr:hypothetical protein GpartN1_g7651.t1 [Galdieria partita]